MGKDRDVKSTHGSWFPGAYDTEGTDKHGNKHTGTGWTKQESRENFNKKVDKANKKDK